MQIHKRSFATAGYRFVMFALSLAVMGIWAKFVRKGNDAGVPADSRWVYGVTIGAISAFSDAFFGVAVLITEYRSIALFWGWETIVFIFWLAVVCIFGPMYAQENPEMDSGIKLMKTSLWIAMAVMVLRLGSCVYATIVVLFSKEVLFEKGRPYLSKRNY